MMNIDSCKEQSCINMFVKIPGAKEENRQDNLKYASRNEIEDSDSELMDTSTDSVDIKKEIRIRRSDHVPGCFVSDTQPHESMELKLWNKEKALCEIRNEHHKDFHKNDVGLSTINSSAMIASNPQMTENAREQPNDTVLATSIITTEIPSINDGNTDLVISSEQNYSLGDTHESGYLDSESLKVLPIIAPVSSNSLRCSPEQVWPSSQSDMAMFEDSNQNKWKQSTKADLHNQSTGSTSTFSTAKISANDNTVAFLPLITTSFQDNVIRDDFVMPTSSGNESASIKKTVLSVNGIKAAHVIDSLKPKDYSPVSNASTMADVNATCLLEKNGINLHKNSIISERLGSPRLEALGALKESEIQKDPHSSLVSHAVKFKVPLSSSIIKTSGLFHSLEAEPSRITPSSSMIARDPTEERISPSIDHPRANQFLEKAESSSSSSISPSENSIPTVSGNSPEKTKDFVIAELKAIKISSILTRNTALEAELASKRIRLEEITRKLKAPAEETIRRHIKLLHDYNNIRDIGQGLIGMIAEQRGVQMGSLYEDYGVSVKD